MTPDAIIQIEKERHGYVKWARELLGTWVKSVGRTKGTGRGAPLRAFSYAQAGAKSAKGRVQACVRDAQPVSMSH